MTVKIFSFILVLSFFFITFKAFSQSKDYVSLASYLNKEKYASTDTIKLALKISIKEHFHINSYKVEDPTLIKTTVSVNSDKFKLDNLFFPADKKLKFEFSENEINVYKGDIIVGLSLLPISKVENGKYELSVGLNYQACDDKVCYAPKSISQKVNIEINSADFSKSGSNTEIFSKINFASPTNDGNTDTVKQTKLEENQRTESPDAGEEDLAKLIEEKGWFAAILLIFLGGLALNLTPCVYPLIPITVSYFGAQTSGSKAQSILMGIFYALGMSVTYSALGVFAALTGSLLGTALQNPFVITGIALVMLALGTSMFGLFEIKVPQSLALMGNKNRSGYFGSLLMGLTVGFIAAPCIGPFVLSLLVVVGKIGSPLTGFLLFFILSMGLGLPYIFLSASSSSISKLPRSGEWMEGVKIIFGLILFGMALNTLEPLIPDNVFAVIFPLYIILSGIYLILIDKKGQTSFAYSKIKYLIAIAAIVMGTWMLKPADAQHEVDWKILTSLDAIEQSVASQKKPVIIDFYADWCAQCKELDKYTYTDPEVVELTKSFNTIKVDLTTGDENITNKFGIRGLPVVLFMNSNGTEYKDLRVTGFLNPEEFKKKILSAQNYTSQ